MSEPTEEGLRRYSQAAGFNTKTTPPTPCTCQVGCPARCAGACGCLACAGEFAAFCAKAGYADMEPATPAAAEAVAAYRAELGGNGPQAIIRRGRFDGR